MTRVAVIGAGIVGLSAAHFLQKAGADVTVYESGTPGSGQSAGESRIFRHAHDDVRLAAFVRHSRALWREWEAEFGVELVSSAGAVAIGDSVEDKLRVLSGLPEVPVKLLAPGQLAAALPILADFQGKAMLDAHGGAIQTRAAFEALAGKLGDALVADHVMAVRPAAGQAWRSGPGPAWTGSTTRSCAPGAARQPWHGAPDWTFLWNSPRTPA